MPDFFIFEIFPVIGVHDWLFPEFFPVTHYMIEFLVWTVLLSLAFVLGGSNVPWFHSEKAKRDRAGNTHFLPWGPCPKFHHLGPVAILAQDLSNTVAIFGSRPRARQVLSQNGHGAKKGSKRPKRQHKQTGLIIWEKAKM